jgi:tetratricopeptide (TPR) repeat protein
MACKHLALSRELAAQAGAKALLPDLHRVAAEAALLAGEPDLARQEALQSRDAARELNMRGDEGHALRACGQAAAALGKAEQAERDLHESVAILQEVGQDYGEALSHLALAGFLVDRGRAEEARPALDRAIPVFERLEAALDLERARALLARLTVGA